MVEPVVVTCVLVQGWFRGTRNKKVKTLVSNFDGAKTIGTPFELSEAPPSAVRHKKGIPFFGFSQKSCRAVLV